MERPNQLGNPEQLSLLDTQNEDSNIEEFDDSWLEGDLGLDEESDRTVEPVARELLTLKLLREAILHQNPGDAVMQDFAEIVLPNLLKYTVGVTAKGGKFFAEYLDRVVNPQRIAAGKDPIRRDNAADQSLNTHLLNGLFPANLIERRLQTLDTTVRRQVKERERRLLVSGFILHDFEKFDYDLIPEMPESFRAIRCDPEGDIRNARLRNIGQSLLCWSKRWNWIALSVRRLQTTGSSIWMIYCFWLTTPSGAMIRTSICLRMG
jgi:CRISPR-associated protein Csc3